MQREKLKYDFEHALLATQIEVQEQAFETVSQDIHDNIGQMLSLGCVQLASVKNSATAPELAEKIEGILQLFKKSVKDLRLLSHSLNTGLIEHRELRQSIKTEFDRIEAFSNIVCKFEAAYDDDALLPKQKIIIFRILQEALQNILKHASASSITVRIAQDSKHIKVNIADDGVGFSEAAVDDKKTLGLLNMQRRAVMLNTTILINSSPGTGTQITFTIPFTT